MNTSLSRLGIERRSLAATLWPAATVVLMLVAFFSQAVPAATLTYPVVDTGQTSCYNDMTTIDCPSRGETFYGQDSQYANAQPSYVDNGDGTITDNVTGLMWTKAFDYMLWANAETAAAALTTGGYTDWRVPTVKELYSLINFTGNQGTGDEDADYPPDDAVPFINTDYFDFEYASREYRYINSQYITSTQYTSTVLDGHPAFFGVNFADGRIKGYSINGGAYPEYYIHFVRGVSDYGTNRFTVNNDGTVTDDGSGLMWSQGDSGNQMFADRLSGYTNSDGSLNWREALDFCENLTLAGHCDWRLPNAKELQTIVDYTRSPDATDSAAIDPVFDTSTIIAENGVLDWPAFWASTSHDPSADGVIICFGRCLGYLDDQFMDVHGAGAQRTDPKNGEPSYGLGPQGDVRRVYNFVRPVRDAD